MARKKHSAKWDRCVREVRRRGGAVNPDAVCTGSLGRKSYAGNPRRRRRAFAHAKRRYSVRRRRTNPVQFKEYLIAARRGTSELYYGGGAKMVRRAKARTFTSKRDAEAMAWVLKDAYGKALAGYSLSVVAA